MREAELSQGHFNLKNKENERKKIQFVETNIHWNNLRGEGGGSHKHVLSCLVITMSDKF